jgi:hypothetical protein
LLVGDITFLSAGIEIGADGLLLNGEGLIADESIISSKNYKCKMTTILFKNNQWKSATNI